MSRLSNESAVLAVGNRDDLVLIASRRAREISRGDLPRLPGTGYPISTALLEIEAGLVGRDYLYKQQNVAARSHHRK